MTGMDSKLTERREVRQPAVMAVLFLCLSAVTGCEEGQTDFGPLLDAVGQGLMDAIIKLVEAGFLRWVL
jgi:hypothetical protein